MVWQRCELERDEHGEAEVREHHLAHRRCHAC